VKGVQLWRSYGAGTARAPRPAVTATAIFVMEPGSQWPAQIDDLASVVGLGSAGDDLLERTREKLGVLLHRREGVRVAVLACNDATGDEAVDYRAALARALLGAVAKTIRGRLILSASDPAPPTVRRALLTLVEELTLELRGTTASVSLWFTEPSHGRVSVPAATWLTPALSRRDRRPS